MAVAWEEGELQDDAATAQMEPAHEAVLVEVPEENERRARGGGEPLAARGRRDGEVGRGEVGRGAEVAHGDALKVADDDATVLQVLMLLGLRV